MNRNSKRRRCSENLLCVENFCRKKQSFVIDHLFVCLFAFKSKLIVGFLTIYFRVSFMMCIVVIVLCVCCYLMCICVLCRHCCFFLTLDAGLLARSQYSEGPATGHLDTGFSWFPCVYKQMLRWFPRFQVATTCFSCSPPDLNLVVTNFMFCIHVK